MILWFATLAAFCWLYWLAEQGDKAPRLHVIALKVSVILAVVGLVLFVWLYQAGVVGR